VIPNGVVLPVLQDQAHARELLGIEPDVPVVLAAGRLAPEKGFDVLVSAVPDIVRRCGRFRVIVCGDGPQRAMLERQVREHGVADYVRFVGYRPLMDAWYAVSDVVAVPSRSEGQGLVAMEALARARPVVASAVGGLPEVVRDGTTGRLVTPECPRALAQAIVELLAKEDLRTSMGEAGRDDAAARFSVDRMLDGVAAVYREAR
jgi:glycosyltransferase involved in cell wall biosynthesis